MFRTTVITALFLAVVVPSALAQDRVGATQKGSLLVYPKVELRWDADMRLKQDTFITLNNDFGSGVTVVIYLISETCTKVTSSSRLTANQPVYWSAASGMPEGVSPWTALGDPYPDPLGSTDKVLRGYILVWAVNGNYEQIRWNHLSGGATTVNYRAMDARTYSAYAFPVIVTNNLPAQGAVVGTPGALRLNGAEYAAGFQYLLLDFFASGSTGLAAAGLSVLTDTDLALLIVHNDLRLDPTGPFTTKARFDVWNENEVALRGPDFCFTKWNLSRLSTLGGAFLASNLQTNKGRARIYGQASVLCFGSRTESLLGVAEQRISFWDADEQMGRCDISSMNLAGAGTSAAAIRYDVPGPPERRQATADSPAESPSQDTPATSGAQ